jgi:protein-disulfide isomerase
MTSRIEKVSTVFLTVAATISAVVLVYREFAAPPLASPAPRRLTYEPKWERAVAVGRIDGDVNAPVKLVEFGDLECPFCGAFHSSVLTLQQRFGNRLAYVFVHFPIPSHRFARPAARALECAGEQGRFFEMLTALYAGQDSFGLKSWAGYAEDAGVRQEETFSACVTVKTTLKPIEDGVSIGQELEVRATPTLFVNGWRIGGAVPASRIIEIVDQILAGKEPK